MILFPHDLVKYSSILEMNIITIEEWNHDIDHAHVLFRAEPKSELSHFINAYKSAGCRLIRKEHPEIRKKLWKEMFRTWSFCLITTGGVPLETIRSYIEHQGEKCWNNPV